MTNRKLAHPHDHLVRYFLSEPDLAADLIANYVVPDIVSLLDLTTLRCESPIQIDEKLIEGICDLLFWASFKSTGRPSAVFIFFEHQSTEDRLISFRILEYMVRAWRKHLDATGLTGLLPYPIVIVLYHGRKPWSKSLILSDLFENVPGVDKNILNFPIHLIDLSTIPMDQLKGHPAVRALFEALQSASEGKLEERFDHVTDQLAAVKNDSRVYGWLKAVTRYMMFLCRRPEQAKEMVIKALRKFMSDKEAKKMETSWAAELINEGEVRGEAKGKAKGKAEGVIDFLEARFGRVPKPVKNAVAACTDLTKLEALIRLAATCGSMDEFRAGMPKTSRKTGCDLN